MPSASDNLPQRIALVHEWFSPRSVGGAERVVQEVDSLLRNLGCEPQLAALIDAESRRLGSWLHGRSVLTSPIQHLPWGHSHVQQYLPLLPFAIEQIDLGAAELVISSSHLVAKGVLTAPDQLHISYVHTPVRYAWDQMHAYLQRSALARRGLGPLVRWQLYALRQWDQLSAQRVDHLIANSRFTARRIRKYWGREVSVIHPPVEVDRFRWNADRDDVYLCLCRLVPYKRVDLVVEAFNRLGLPLLVVGDGPERARLDALAGPTVTLLGRQSQQQVEELMARCRAFVYAGLEDFGIAPVEAMAAGAPVIGLGRGGLLDTVRCASAGLREPTGVLFPDQNVESLVQAVEWFEQERIWRSLDSESIRAWAERFRPEAFAARFESALRTAWSTHQQGCAVAASDPAEMPGLRL
ncbi:glycosyltransferase family 4 protein [Synechococcus sp. MU1643]|uniref:glycosyltransferase n=1 Tax=Synechococcus sp. MU1643 TaxID=2508349 RepID=UPI001CF868FA|nr:glycosyltransferase [Synechococcus sp. MU1643]MCB4428372.1 glycosyltransferase family 4 protein [Synechococcus sp. MU1643]